MEADRLLVGQRWVEEGVVDDAGPAHPPPREQHVPAVSSELQSVEVEVRAYYPYLTTTTKAAPLRGDKACMAWVAVRPKQLIGRGWPWGLGQPEA